MVLRGVKIGVELVSYSQATALWTSAREPRKRPKKLKRRILYQTEEFWRENSSGNVELGVCATSACYIRKECLCTWSRTLSI